MTSTARLIVLVLLAVPVFTGWMPFSVGRDVLPGVGPAPLLSALLVPVGVAVLCGRAFLANALAVTALILAPVVFAGGTVSWLLGIVGGVDPSRAGSLNGPHYVRLALNMIGVIPLALALVAAIPFDRLEQRLLRSETGISRGEKYLLMFIRVFHHTVYFVIPNLLEVMREEALLQDLIPRPGRKGARTTIRAEGGRVAAGLVQIGVSGICAALRFIPLWAREIDDLPRRAPTSQRRKQ